MLNDINLYIPTGVKAENELFNGFGKRELFQLQRRKCGADRSGSPVRHFRFGDDVYQRPEQSKRG